MARRLLRRWALLGLAASIERRQCRSSQHRHQSKRAGRRMRELLRTNNLVRLSYLLALLRAEAIEAQVLDGPMSVPEGRAGAIPRRMVGGADEHAAGRRVLEAGGGRGAVA